MLAEAAPIRLMIDKSIRRLSSINGSASSSRVINLVKLHQAYSNLEEYSENPLFFSSLLNRSIILKHRLRANELDLFEDHRSVVTKIILPMDRNDLRIGGQYVFLGQKGEDIALSYLTNDGSAEGARDRKTLSILDSLPSFDPFLVREHLRRQGLAPAACYFSISSADSKRMHGFIEDEIRTLAGLSLGGDVRVHASIAALASKLMSNETAAEMDPLRVAMKMDRESFVDGLFAWKGLLYYKWVLTDLNSQLPRVIEEISSVAPAVRTNGEVCRKIRIAQKRISMSVGSSLAKARIILNFYDRAFNGLTHRNKPLEFRDFLLEAPHLFIELGDTLGILSHVVSYWRYRFPRGASIQVGEAELAEILFEFEAGLTGGT